MSAADGHIYVRSHQTLTLVEANPKAYVEKGRIEKVHNLRNTGPRSQKGLLDWNMPVIARGRLYIRTPIEIICYDIREGGTARPAPGRPDAPVSSRGLTRQA